MTEKSVVDGKSAQNDCKGYFGGTSVGLSSADGVKKTRDSFSSSRSDRKVDDSPSRPSRRPKTQQQRTLASSPPCLDPSPANRPRRRERGVCVSTGEAVVDPAPSPRVPFPCPSESPLVEGEHARPKGGHHEMSDSDSDVLSYRSLGKSGDRHSRSRSLSAAYSNSQRAKSLPALRSTSRMPEFALEPDVDPLREHGEKVKTKLLSMWNNVKYGWTIKTKTNFRYDSPIFLLGEQYHRRQDEEDEKKNDFIRYPRISNMELFKQDFFTRIWFTYRKDFFPLVGTKITTDCGWGCMIRSGQMILAQAFVNHFLGRDWRILQLQSDHQNLYHRQIIRWFADSPTHKSPFSVHQLVDIGRHLGRQAGEWYGPATVANMLRQAMRVAYDFQPILSDICIYVASDCTVYKQEVYDMCLSPSFNMFLKLNKKNLPDMKPEECKWRRAVIILIPVRLGGEIVNPLYVPCLQSMLAEEHCIGIIGGKPKHSLYFIGWQDKQLIYLDPHYCQETVDVSVKDFPIQVFTMPDSESKQQVMKSFHCLTPRKLAFEDMDPSCTIGFYCKTREDFEKFVKQTEELAANSRHKGVYPAFAFTEGSSSDLELEKLNLREERCLKIRYMDEDGKIHPPAGESDDFVVL